MGLVFRVRALAVASSVHSGTVPVEMMLTCGNILAWCLVQAIINPLWRLLSVALIWGPRNSGSFPGSAFGSGSGSTLAGHGFCGSWRLAFTCVPGCHMRCEAVPRITLFSCPAVPLSPSCLLSCPSLLRPLFPCFPCSCSYHRHNCIPELTGPSTS